jgi:hypothetical protein
MPEAVRIVVRRRVQRFRKLYDTGTFIGPTGLGFRIPASGIRMTRLSRYPAISFHPRFSFFVNPDA